MGKISPEGTDGSRETKGVIEEEDGGVGEETLGFACGDGKEGPSRAAHGWSVNAGGWKVRGGVVVTVTVGGVDVITGGMGCGC